MKTNFKTNPCIPFEEIHDSMQLDSGTVIATLEVGDYRLKLEVEGDVRVHWNPDPTKSWEDEGTEIFRHACQMPDELLQIFSQDKPAEEFPNLHVVDNNWYETIVYYKGTIVFSDLTDMDELDPSEIFTSLWDMYLEFKKDEQQLEEEFRERTKNFLASDGETEDIRLYDVINKLGKAPMSEDDVHELLAGTLYDDWDYPVGKLNDMHFKYDPGKGRYGGIQGT